MNASSFRASITGPSSAIAQRGRVDTIPRGTEWKRYVALGDSLTEGLCDTSRQADGDYRGWADRLAMLIAHATPSNRLAYANLAVRSRRIADVLDVQIPRAIELEPNLVSVLIGGNDLMWFQTPPARLLDDLANGVVALRRAGCDVLLVTPFTPPHRYLRGIQGRFDRFNRDLRVLARETGCILLDFGTHPEFLAENMWAADRVHLSAQGHRALAYRAARALCVPHARALGALDVAMHDEALPAESVATARWLWVHARPWLGRRMLGRTAGDGRSAKHSSLVPVVPPERAGVTPLVE